MVTKAFVPRRGEIVHLDEVAGAGHEQSGDRPHVVLTTQGYNDKTSLVTCVPVSTRIRGFPFEVRLGGLARPGVALVHQVTTADWRARGATKRGVVSKEELGEIDGKLRALLLL